MEKNSLKDTVNLPKTDFPIRAGLAEKEPALIAQWDEMKLYEKRLEQLSQPEKSFVLHDGPPYPNGSIHAGHALNKVLKDILVRYHQMCGYASRYVPGWDCHGLPIETQVLKELQASGEEEKKSDVTWFRNRCREFALRYVEDQKIEFKRLGILGEWDAPYLTLNPEYEAETIALFGKMAERGLVYRGRKPIHWSIACKTALAEAEIEYHDHKSPSIYVTFHVVSPSDALKNILKNDDARLIIWTTTPWTLPGNVAIAAHPTLNYVVAKTSQGTFVFAESLKEKLTELLEWSSVDVLGSLSGEALFGTETQHPLFDRISKVVTADYVTDEDGSGFVHIAPGHGQDDYQVGLKYGLPILMHVDDDGRFTDAVPEWKGMMVFDANKPIGEALKANGSLLKLKFITHSYPYCWRSKTPVIFRATEQWFIGMDVKGNSDQTLRERALKGIRETKWYPAWGEKRITPMIENRPDWCISRQRFWGIPIPVFTCQSCGNHEMSGAFNEAVVALVKREGTLGWFSRSADEILPKELKCSQCQKRNFSKDQNILDVWFESGSSFGSVIDRQADLYLEGSDQHRGWFQSSLLIGLGAESRVPYKGVLTHGFLVDDKGKKMSKSLGNVISPQSIIKEYGADILRWWVASSDFRNDVSLAKSILDQCRDTFSKVRNTIRFCLSNLYDFRDSDRVEYDQMDALDQWVLAVLQNLIRTVHEAYQNYEFHVIVHAVHDFCAVTLSSVYLDSVKDRLYCDAVSGKRRRSTQTALFEIVHTLLGLLAPILVFTTEDAYAYCDVSDKKSSVHLEKMPVVTPQYDRPDVLEKWKQILAVRDQVYQSLEVMRSEKTIRSFLEVRVHLTLPDDVVYEDWTSLLIVSQVVIRHGDVVTVSAEKIEGEKCARCWKFVPLHDDICERCKEAISC
jgi:isoleucyl-tRNA synthetase